MEKGQKDVAVEKCYKQEEETTVGVEKMREEEEKGEEESERIDHQF